MDITQIPKHQILGIYSMWWEFPKSGRGRICIGKKFHEMLKIVIIKTKVNWIMTIWYLLCQLIFFFNWGYKLRKHIKIFYQHVIFESSLEPWYKTIPSWSQRKIFYILCHTTCHLEHGFYQLRLVPHLHVGSILVNYTAVYMNWKILSFSSSSEFYLDSHLTL